MNTLFKHLYHKSEVYQNDVCTLKKYDDTHCTLVLQRAVRLPGFEEHDRKVQHKKELVVNADKLENSLSRSRKTVHEYALCNPWELFATLTMSPARSDRYDVESMKHTLTKWIKNMNYRNDWEIRYLLIPEPHKDGAWHFHGLLSGIPSEQMLAFQPDDHIPARIKDILHSGRIVYDWPLYREKFGWVTMEPIIDRERCAKYITKYITKDLMQSRIALNSHVYVASQGLKKAEIICRGALARPFEPDYQNDFVKVKLFDNLAEPLSYFFEEDMALWQHQQSSP